MGHESNLWREVYRESAKHQIGNSPVLNLCVIAYYTGQVPYPCKGIGIVTLDAWDGSEQEINALNERLGAEVFFATDYGEVIRRAQRVLYDAYRHVQELFFDTDSQEWYGAEAEVLP